MTKTGIEFLKDCYVGKRIMVQVFTGYHIKAKRETKHFYPIGRKDMMKYYPESQYRDVKVEQTSVEITDVEGGYIPYEGNYVNLIVDHDYMISLEICEPLEFTMFE